MFERSGTPIPVASPSQYVDRWKETEREISANWYSQIYAAEVKISRSRKPMHVAGIE